MESHWYASKMEPVERERKGQRERERESRVLQVHGTFAGSQTTAKPKCVRLEYKRQFRGTPREVYKKNIKGGMRGIARRRDVS